MKLKVVLLAGNIGAGKDTVAKFLEADRHYKHVKFADRLKDFVALLLDKYEPDLSHRKLDIFVDREVKDTRIVWNGLTTRQLLQKIGTDCFRKGLDENIWVNELKFELMHVFNGGYNKFVVSDCRFPNEYTQFVQDSYFDTTLIYIEREEVDILARPATLSHLQHSSESHHSFLKSHADIILQNNGALSDLKFKVLGLSL